MKEFSENYTQLFYLQERVLSASTIAQTIETTRTFRINRMFESTIDNACTNGNIIRLRLVIKPSTSLEQTKKTKKEKGARVQRSRNRKVRR